MLCKEIPLQQGCVLQTYIMDPQTSFHVYKKRPAMIICPGGAYLIHATKEGEPIALTFLEKGYNCFVLRYTVGTDREHPETGFNETARYPLQALQLMEAILTVRRHAEEWYIDADRVFVAGFSAGAHVCATVGTRWNDPALLDRLPFAAEPAQVRPTAMVLGYPMLALNPPAFQQKASELQRQQTALVNRVVTGTETPTAAQCDAADLTLRVTTDTVPTFLWHSIDDPVVDCNASMRFIQAMLGCGCNCEFHLYNHGEHGKGLAGPLSAQSAADTDEALHLWVALAEQFLRKIPCP